EKGHIGHLRSCARLQPGDWHCMVTFDVTIPKLSIPILEVKRANLADQIPMLPHCETLGPHHECSIPLPRPVCPEEDSALWELVFLVLGRSNRFVGWRVI